MGAVLVEQIGFSVFSSSFGPMPFLPVMDLWIASDASLEPALPSSMGTKASLEQIVPEDKPTARDKALEPVLPLEIMMEIKPFVLEGSVEKFDPVARAAEIASSIPRKWCGTYRSFAEEANIDVTLTFSKVNSIGQMVDLHGEMSLGSLKTPVHGNLNAKSDQLELIPLADKLMPGLEPGGSFVGLQGAQLFSWKSPRLDNPGGRLELKKECIDQISKAPAVFTIW